MIASQMGRMRPFPEIANYRLPVKNHVHCFRSSSFGTGNRKGQQLITVSRLLPRISVFQRSGNKREGPTDREETMGRLEGRVAVVTGAGKGLGKAFCIRLAQEGANIVAVTRADTEGLERTGKEVRTLGREVAAEQGRRFQRRRHAEDGTAKRSGMVRADRHPGEQRSLLLRSYQDSPSRR